MELFNYSHVKHEVILLCFFNKNIKSIIEIIYKFYIIVKGQTTILVFLIVADKTIIILKVKKFIF
jgi:hypothetical protein